MASGQVMSKCDPTNYTEEEAWTREWLKASSKRTVLDKHLLGDFDKVTEGIHTGDLESIYGLNTKHVPKRNKFSPPAAAANVRGSLVVVFSSRLVHPQ